MHNSPDSTHKFYVVIPARYASTRLPGKPLLEIGDRPMVVHVADRARLSGASQIIVATDDSRIVEASKQYGYYAMLTRADHASGTDRIAEVAQREGWSGDAIVVNVQGDEPLIDPELITEVATKLAANPEAVMATACHRIHSKADFVNPNIVKVVLDKQGHALYFSRAPIPYPRDTYTSDVELPSDLPVYRHIGIYAYRVNFLNQYAHIQPAAIEHYESLEQLRVLYHGYKIAVAITDNAPATGVDTEADLAYVRSILT